MAAKGKKSAEQKKTTIEERLVPERVTRAGHPLDDESSL